MKNNTNNKYKEGEIVCAMADPSTKLIIRRYLGNIYYCKVQGDPEQKELVFFERELLADHK